MGLRDAFREAYPSVAGRRARLMLVVAGVLSLVLAAVFAGLDRLTGGEREPFFVSFASWPLLFSAFRLPRPVAGLAAMAAASAAVGVGLAALRPPGGPVLPLVAAVCAAVAAGGFAGTSRPPTPRPPAAP